LQSEFRMSAFFALLLSCLAIFLILLVLVQRGRGGGLAGALGGMGGSSAFGAKAGDVFTRITIVTASIWIVISIIAYFWADHRGDAFGSASSASAPFGAPADVTPPAPLSGQTNPPAAGTTTESGTAPASTTPPPAENAAPPAAAETAPPDNNE
jgi:preprotein translocase subunit SecG